MKQTLSRLLLSTALVVPTLALAAPPQPEEGTLRKIASSGVIALGYHESTPPFTFRTADGTVMGYSYDFALKIADAVKRELNLPTLKIVQVPFTTQNRFPTIQNGSADISCGATTNTTERQKIVAFSNTIFVAGSRLMTRKDSGIKDFSDLTGKNVVTFAASTSEKMLRKLNAEQNRRIHIVSTFDRGETPFSVLQAGHADAYMMDDVLLYAAIHETWRPTEWMVTGTPQSFEAYGCILRKDDPAFKKVVDQEIARMMKSGEAEANYRKWLLSPTPPKGVNFGVAMSQAMVDLFKNPNDRPFD
ncbi:MAG: transporter substrate-binding domain-containing protein [Rhodoferax sp.]|nr:transporter substrate-binding domain-containing protein [Rhodoferax sp.]MCF8210681.1 transporter substrate-binding domain-containing protein [Rhodoferax sp.]